MTILKLRQKIRLQQLRQKALETFINRVKRHTKHGAAPGYQQKLENEQAFYRDVSEVHKLPDIFHYWSNKHLRPVFETFGFSNPDEFFVKELIKLAENARLPLRILSIGSGNCDQELKLAIALRDRRVEAFRIECLDINKHMLDRGWQRAKEEGLEQHFVFSRQDFNRVKLETQSLDVILANQCLHHVVNLEGLFSEIHSAMKADAVFLVSDMIGRNGHLRWPEARKEMETFWNELPKTYRYNRLLRRQEQAFIDHDCSQSGFEGIRAQDILPLMIEQFEFELFIPYGNIIFPFIDRAFGHHFNADADWDRDFIDRVHAHDVALMEEGVIKPTSMLAVMKTKGSELKPRYLSAKMTPEFCVRPTGEQRLHVVQGDGLC